MKYLIITLAVLFSSCEDPEQLSLQAQLERVQTKLFEMESSFLELSQETKVLVKEGGPFGKKCREVQKDNETTLAQIALFKSSYDELDQKRKAFYRKKLVGMEFDEYRSNSGQTLQKAKILKINPKGITFAHSHGIQLVSYSDIDYDLKQRVLYSNEEYKSFLKKENEEAVREADRMRVVFSTLRNQMEERHRKLGQEVSQYESKLKERQRRTLASSTAYQGIAMRSSGSALDKYRRSGVVSRVNTLDDESCSTCAY